MPGEMLGPSRSHLQGDPVVPSLCIGSVVKTFPLNQVEETRSLATPIHFAIKDPIDLPLI